jgi:hypothetical protein
LINDPINVVNNVNNTSIHFNMTVEYGNNCLSDAMRDSTYEKYENTMIAHDNLPSLFFSSKKKKLLITR